MSVIKQKSVTEKGHAKNLRDYINGKEALLRDFQNIFEPARWSYEMDCERRRRGHDRPARKGARNTIMYHQVIAFLPEEADVNGGKMTPELCMGYAREYARRRYPDQQIAFALHKEVCKEDRTARYAVHMAINRSNVRTGLRLDEGRGEAAKRDRAAAVRRMDAEWGLRQVEKGVPNSELHRQQPQRRGVERDILDRAAKRGVAPAKASVKYGVRERCRAARGAAKCLEEYLSLLARAGVDARVEGGKVYVSDSGRREYEFSLARLDRDLSANGLEAAFARNAGDGAMAALEKKLEGSGGSYASMKDGYLEAVKSRYRDYCELVRSNKGAPYGAMPQIKMPRTPPALQKDMAVARAVLSYVAKGDELRARLSRDGAALRGARPRDRAKGGEVTGRDVRSQDAVRDERGGKGR